MMPTSFRVARTLLYLSAGFAFAPPFMILALSGEPGRALPYIVLFFLTGALFVQAARDLRERMPRARMLAVAGAVALAALGSIAGFSLGMVTFPGAAIGVGAAWATFLIPPRRRVMLALAVYLAIGLALALVRGIGFGFIWAIPTIAIWPVWMLFIPMFSIVPIYLAIAVAVILAVRAFTAPRPFEGGVSRARLSLAVAIGLLGAALVVAAFIGFAYAQPDTSARFELTPLVLGVVAAGGLMAGTGALLLRSSGLGAAFFGLGVVVLLFTFSYGPAVTCSQSGYSQRQPLEWALTQISNQGFSGSGMRGPGGSEEIGSGEFTIGDRTVVYRCEGAHLVEYREVR